jgi:hypothetical protein
MSDTVAIDRLMAAVASPDPARAPSRLKSRIYSSLVLRQAESGPLRSLTETKAEGRKLCVFEELVQISPVGESVKMRNPCRVCHARLLGEQVEDAPIHWPHCPYVLFQNS